MDRRNRLEILAQADAAVLLLLAEEILATSEAEVIKQPETSLLMARANDSVTGSPFNLGEILVTESEVRLGNHIGYSLIMGEESERALAAAVIDAALEGGHASTSSIEEKLGQEESRLKMEKEKEFGLVAQTRVDFEIVRD